MLQCSTAGDTSVCVHVHVWHIVSRAKTTESIEMLYKGRLTWAQLNHVLDEDAYGRNLANMTERSVLGSDAACHYHHCDHLLSIVLSTVFS